MAIFRQKKPFFSGQKWSKNGPKVVKNGQNCGEIIRGGPPENPQNIGKMGDFLDEIGDPQTELLLLRICMPWSKLGYLLRTSPISDIDWSAFDKGIKSNLERSGGAIVRGGLDPGDIAHSVGGTGAAVTW